MPRIIRSRRQTLQTQTSGLLAVSCIGNNIRDAPYGDGRRCSMPHDFKYIELVRGAEKWRSLVTSLQTVRTEPLRAVAEAFMANCERTNVAAVAPAHVAVYSRREQHMADCAVFAEKGTLNFDLKQFSRPKDMSEGFKEHYKRFFLEWADTVTDEEYKDFFGHWGVTYIDLKLRFFKGLQKYMESLLASVVIESWTAFETLATDLWTVALNQGPPGIANAVALSSHLRTGTSRGRADKVRHDHRKEYGSWLLEVGWVSFRRLDDIRLFYAEAFGTDARKMFDEAANGYIYALAAYRNALIHTSGKADREFVTRVQRFAELRSISEGDALMLDGALVKKLQQAAHDLGEQLIHFVDGVMTPSPEPATE